MSRSSYLFMHIKTVFNIHIDFGRLSDSHVTTMPFLFKLYMD